MIPVVTIDGPSGAGKGTIAQNVARELGWGLLDSGSLYRLTALACIQQTIDFEDLSAIELIARNLPVSFQSVPDGLKIFLNNEDVSDAIREETIGMAASKVAAMGGVRDALLERQRAFVSAPGLIADGRDMGTTVFPQAPLKIFMTASCEERAQRRYKQLKEKGISVSLAALVADLKARDEQDSNRPISPLRPADDAIMIDTSNMSIEQVTQKVLELVKQTFS
ncbi:MAG: (d)CMP kinase [Gammaproteobacteria bacterium]|nr:(d)CMP kinase [Gammaproteobacteria bacterium]MDH5735593.1 (d)CMP kinase [Gammaproteobacteria bacterium]